MPSGGPFDPRQYGQHSNSRTSVCPPVVAQRAGSFDPRGFTIEPVQCNARVSGETPIAQAISAQAYCRDAHRDYLDSLDAARDPDPRALQDPRAQAQLQQQKRAFGTTEAAKFATERAPQVAADRAAQAERQLEQQLAGLRQDGDAAQEQRNTRQWESASRLLDSQTPGEAVATAARLLENASTAELSVLCEQLPSYLQSKGLDKSKGFDPDWMLPVLTKRPELADAATEVAMTRQAKAIVDGNARRIKQCIAEGHSPYAPLLDAANFDPDAAQ
jgi:hypothetical protein